VLPEPGESAAVPEGTSASGATAFAENALFPTNTFPSEITPFLNATSFAGTTPFAETTPFGETASFAGTAAFPGTAALPGNTGAPPNAARLALVAGHDSRSAALVERLLRASVRVLPQARVAGEFAFTLTGTRDPDGIWQLSPSGASRRYAAIVALGLMRLSQRDQRTVLGGEDGHDFVGRLARRLDWTTNLGDVALLCWAAAEAAHGELPHALDRLAELDRPDNPVDVVAAAWVVTALVAIRPLIDVEQHLSAARDRLLAARSEVYPHVAVGATTWYRSHVGSFADQVYPLQALARLHGSADDPRALAAAESVAAAICRAQGNAGQWCWHYDARTGGAVESYPVYSAHQYAMAPMALLDLADAGGQPYLEAICQGLRWLTRPPEIKEDLILDEPPVTWRKVARADRRMAGRGLRAVSTGPCSLIRFPVLDRAFRPSTVGHECRPYELGWLLMAWLPAMGGLG
jgi:hypothetical protein